jgi:hypothetical protein
MIVYPTPEAAARGDVPERYAPVLTAARSPDGQHAVLLLGMNGPPIPYPWQEVCSRGAGGWVGGPGGNGSGWTCTSANDDPAAVGVTTPWDEAPPAARAAVVSFAGVDHEVPVENGY